MQALSGTGDIDALVEIIGLFAPDGGGNITRGIKGRAVALEDEGGRHPVCVERDDPRAVILHEQLFSRNSSTMAGILSVKKLSPSYESNSMPRSS